jgi:hypothetical protein
LSGKCLVEVFEEQHVGPLLCVIFRSISSYSFAKVIIRELTGETVSRILLKN